MPKKPSIVLNFPSNSLTKRANNDYSYYIDVGGPLIEGSALNGNYRDVEAACIISNALGEAGYRYCDVAEIVVKGKVAAASPGTLRLVIRGKRNGQSAWVILPFQPVSHKKIDVVVKDALNELLIRLRYVPIPLF